MLAAALAPMAAKFCRQIVPPVVATLIAAVLIAAYNKTFSGHLVQPRMAALHAAEAAADSTTAPITTVGMTKPPAPPAPPVTETITIYEEAIAPERLAEKDSGEEARKDQSVRLAAEPAPAPARTAAPKAEVRIEPRVEPHRVAAVELAQPMVRAPVPVIVALPPAVVAPPATAPVVAAMPLAEQRSPQYPQPYPPPYQPQVQIQPQPQLQPPPVIVGTAPMVTVPDRMNARAAEDAQAAPPPAQGPLGTFVNALKPSTWFARAREFGDRIEQAGNDILPSIRQ